MSPDARPETTDAAEGRRLERGVWSPFRALLSAQVIAAALGLAFWVLVARLVDADEVGVAAAAISAQTLLGLLTPLGIGTTLISELPHHDPARQRRLVLRSLLVVLVFSTIVGGVVVALAPLLTGSLREALGEPIGAIAFILGVIAAGWSIVIDECCLGLRRSQVQVGRNLLAAGLRFPLTAVLLLGFGLTESRVLQVVWVLPLLLSVGVALWRLRLPRGDRSSPALRTDITTYVGFALRNHTLSLALAGASQMVPVVAGLTLASVANAEFAIAWLIATFVFLPPYLLTTALFAHGANMPTEEFRRSMERTLPTALVLSGLLCVGAWVLGGPVLMIFGGQYATESWQILALLVPGGLWMVFKDHLVALWRTERRFKLATRLAAGALVLEVAGATIGAVLGGATGLCLGWLAAMGLEVVLSAPWLRQGLGGLHWRWPTVPLRRRTAAGRVAPHVLASVAIVLAVLGVGVWSSTQGSGSTDSDDNPSAGPGPTGSTGATEEPGCERGADRPGPRVDLGVQAATGDPEAPLRSYEEIRQLVRLAERAGASVISTTASFRALQPKPGMPYRFTGMDRVIGAARSAGMEVRLRVIGMPDWALDEPTGKPRQPPETEAELQRWATYVENLMRHVRGKVSYVEIWNEPNSQAYWSTGPDPVAFMRLLATTYEIVHRVAPATKVVSGGLIGNDIGYLEEMYAAADTLGLDSSPFDLLGVHPFTNGAAPADVDPARRYDREPWGPFDENFTGFTALHDVMAENGDEDLPLFISQFGYSDRTVRRMDAVPDKVRADYLTEAFNLVTCEPYVEAFSWYALHPTPWDPPSWTLVDENYRPNLTYAALVRWANRAPMSDR